MALNYQVNDPTNSGNSGGFDWSSLISPTIGAAGSAISAGQLKNGIGAANAQQNATYGQIAGIYQPQYSLGVGADKGLASALGIGGAAPDYAAFENTPGYQFALQQGNQAINRQAAASGNAFNSSTLAALGQYNVGLANQTYQSYVQNLLATAGLGNQAAGGMASARYNTGANVGQGLANIGAANASGVQGAAQSLVGPASSLARSLFNSAGSGASGVSGLGGGGSAAIAGDYSGLTGAGGAPFYLDSSGVASDAGSGLGSLASGTPDWLGFNAAGGGAAADASAVAGGDAAAAAGGADAAGSAGLGAVAGGALGLGLVLGPALYGMSRPSFTTNSDWNARMQGYINAGPGPYASTQGFNGSYWDPQYMDYMAAQQAFNGTDWNHLVASGAVPFAPGVTGGPGGSKNVGNS